MSAAALIQAARALSRAVSTLRFGPPVAHVYNPLDYAWAPHEAWLRRYGEGRKRIVFVGMNPGPFGMMQTGVPFGEVAAVRDWMGVQGPVRRPADEQPKRPIEGFACRRSEVSGKRLWGWAAARFGSAPAFFEHCFVLNYCPLVFMEASARNLTPDKLPAAVAAPLFKACDTWLRQVVAIYEPQWVVGVGGFARKKLDALFADAGAAGGASPRRGTLLHPSPASPAANRGWEAAALSQLREQGIWD